jgi:transketolase
MLIEKRTEDINVLEDLVRQARIELVKMFSTGKAHHFGGSLSCVDVVTALYASKLKMDSVDDPDRDRFIMSKGHTVPVQYVLMAMRGFIPMEELSTIKKLGTRLQGHPDVNKTPGIEAPTGSLGMGLSYANGIALAARMNKQKFNIFVMMGDGELQEGQPWEAAMTSAHYKLGNVCVIVDANRFQSQGSVDDVLCIEPLEEKFKAFGWNVKRVNGHNMEEIMKVLNEFTGKDNQPTAIIADTIKGKGINFMENTHKFHNFNLNEKQYVESMKQLGGNA